MKYAKKSFTFGASQSNTKVVHVGCVYGRTGRLTAQNGGPRPGAKLVQALAGLAEAARRAACWGSGAAGPGAVPALAPLLAHADPLIVRTLSGHQRFPQ